MLRIVIGGLLRCRSCGCVIRWVRPGARRDLRMGINMRLFDHALMTDVPVKVLDGDQTWRVLGAYVKPRDVDLAVPRHEAASRPATGIDIAPNAELENANPSDGALSIDLENGLENDLEIERSANSRHRRGR